MNDWLGRRVKVVGDMEYACGEVGIIELVHIYGDRPIRVLFDDGIWDTYSIDCLELLDEPKPNNTPLPLPG